MIPPWSDLQRQSVINAVFADFAIPLEVALSTEGVDAPSWKVHAFGGTVQASLDRIHSRQDRIVRRYAQRGVRALSSREALFMYASQWLEWVVFEGARDPDHDDVLELMEGWFILHAGLKDGFRS